MQYWFKTIIYSSVRMNISRKIPLTTSCKRNIVSLLLWLSAPLHMINLALFRSTKFVMQWFLLIDKCIHSLIHMVLRVLALWTWDNILLDSIIWTSCCYLFESIYGQMVFHLCSYGPKCEQIGFFCVLSQIHSAFVRHGAILY